MSGINKQKFLTELGRLLTFMYEEDREYALAMYSRLFDETGDETGLLQLLVSPTRQAVNLARAYDARERKLQVQAQSRGEAPDGEEPGFVRVIDQLREQAAALGMAPRFASVDEGTLFAEENVQDSALFAEEEPEQSPPEPIYDDLPEDPEDAPEAQELPESVPAVEREPLPEDDSGSDAEDESAGEAEKLSDAVEAFLSDFSIENDELVRRESEAPAPVEPPPPPEEEPQPERADELPDLPPLDDESGEEHPPAPKKGRSRSHIHAGSKPVFTVSKPRVGLLLLFLLFAVPITLVCIVLLLVPAALSLGVGLLAGWLGLAGVLAAFGGFSVFADILLVFGCTLVVLALALLFLWIFLWLLAGAIPGVIRGVCALARKWCYKEVPVR